MLGVTNLHTQEKTYFLPDQLAITYVTTLEKHIKNKDLKEQKAFLALMSHLYANCYQFYQFLEKNIDFLLESATKPIFSYMNNNIVHL